MPSIYVHFPWCLAKCPYCDFVSYAAPRENIDHEGYADVVVRELAVRKAELLGKSSPSSARITTMFFGGGTPSLWNAKALGRVIAAAREHFDLDSAAEITVECNPTSLDRDHAERLRDVGVNRVSIGVQALDDKELAFLGRLHDEAGALSVVEQVSRVEGLRVSADLIFGLPDQSPEKSTHHATRLADLGLSHMSCYELTIEEGTRFFEMAKRGRLPRAKDDAVIDAFLAIDELLSSRGFLHYEISNYAKPGNEARHNLGYWRGESYVGVGCAAVGFMRDDANPARGHRYRNETSPEKYMQNAPISAHGDTAEILDAETLLRERIMLGLRMAKGFDAREQERDLGVTFFTKERAREVDSLVTKGRLARDGDILRIPKRAWLFANDTASRLF